MRILHVTPGTAPAEQPAVPALAYLPHTVDYSGFGLSALAQASAADVIVFDATEDLNAAGGLALVLENAGRQEPVLAVLSEGGLIAANPDWKVSDIVLASAGPAEVDARLRLAAGRGPATSGSQGAGVLEIGPLRIDEDAYAAFVRERQLDLTYKEFELLRHLAANAGRALTRAELLHDVWGYDFFGGTRTVDVHVRRLRAKLGAELDQVIHTVRNVGYRFSPEVAERVGAGSAASQSNPRPAVGARSGTVGGSRTPAPARGSSQARGTGSAGSRGTGSAGSRISTSPAARATGSRGGQWSR